MSGSGWKIPQDINIVCVLQCLPLWPENPSGKLCVRVVGSGFTSKCFVFNRQDNGTLLSLDTVSVSPLRECLRLERQQQYF